MSNKLKFHYQQIRHTDDKHDPYKVHEAYSIGGIVEMINPHPIELVADTKEALAELVGAVECDIELYGVLTYKEAERAMQAYQSYVYTDDVILEAVPEYEDEEVYDEFDYFDAEDKVITIDEYFRRNA